MEFSHSSVSRPTHRSRSERSKWPKKVLSFRDFERSRRFSHEKSRFLRSGHQLPQACDRSRSERENHGFSAITSSKSIFRDIFVIFVVSPSRIFRKNDFQQLFEHQHNANDQKSCSIFANHVIERRVTWIRIPFITTARRREAAPFGSCKKEIIIILKIL